MLQIKQICKQYKTGDLVQNALNNVSLNLRDNESVSYTHLTLPTILLV